MIRYKIKDRNGILIKHRKHRLLSRLMILTAFCLLCLPLLVSRAEADTPTSSRMNESSGYSADIYDEANLLTPEEEEQLLDTMFAVTRNGYAVLVTIDQNPVQSEVVYTNSFYKHHYGEDENGAIMLIDMNLRILRLECYNRIEDFISANDSYTIVDNCYTLASAGRYADCAAKVLPSGEFPDQRNEHSPSGQICGKCSLSRSFRFSHQLLCCPGDLQAPKSRP